jgi:hypothetical protein
MFKNNLQKILKNSKKGYTLVYTLTAMIVCCALVFSTISISTYYNNNLAKKNGTRGALSAAQSGFETTESYLNYCYRDINGGGATSAKELYINIYDILNELIVTSESTNGTELSGFILQGYSNYTYGFTAENPAILTPNSEGNISYKVYYSKLLMDNLKTRGELTLLSLGEYVQNNKAYYKFITTTVLLQPNYDSDGRIGSFDFKTIQYNETLKGGTDLWGNVQW